jgi:prophage antirepressor-like protein
MTSILETLQDNYILFEQNSINIIMDTNDILWFNAYDLTLALGYTEAKRMVQIHIDQKDKIQLKNINHNYHIKNHPNSIYLNESGLYTLLIKSNKPNAKKFTAWITNDVLPSIRKYGYYKMKTKFEQDKSGLLQQINYLQKQTKTMEADLKKDKYPDGNLVYIIDYSDGDTTLPGIFRIGMTKHLKARKQLYDTHTLNKKKVVHYELVKDPIRLEYCLRSMLYKYRYRDNKDFYVCSLAVVKRAFKKCLETLQSMNSNVQTGGANLPINNILVKLQNKITRLDKSINKYNKLIVG